MRRRAGERGRAGGGSAARHRAGRDGDGGEFDGSRMRGNGEQQEEKRKDTPRATDGHSILQKGDGERQSSGSSGLLGPERQSNACASFCLYINGYRQIRFTSRRAGGH